jgi:two-component system chemotaxis response regulator CheB
LALDKNIVQRWRNSEILLLGGSAGALKLILKIVRSFPPDLNKTVIIVIHRKKNFFSEIEKLFTETIRIKFREISDKEPIKNNIIYIAPPNYHTLIENQYYFSLDVSEAVWYSRPSIDVTFESAAEVYNHRCTAVLFSGANQDGAEGLLKLRNSGSLTIVQEPGEAEMSEMPASAIRINAAEYVLKNSEIFELFQI